MEDCEVLFTKQITQLDIDIEIEFFLLPHKYLTINGQMINEYREHYDHSVRTSGSCVMALIILDLAPKFLLITTPYTPKSEIPDSTVRSDGHGSRKRT